MNQLWIFALPLALQLSPVPVANELPESQDPVVATVAERAIYQSQVDWEFRRKFGNRSLGPELKDRLQARILEQLIKQNLVLEKFQDSDVAAHPDEVDLRISRLREQLQTREITLEQYLQDNQQTMHGLRFELYWQISWDRYLQRTLSDEVLQKYFQKHHRQFDGTQLQVAHILWATQPDDPDWESSTRQEAETLRRRITEGSISWSEACRQYSAAPSAQQGGDVGWIEHDRPMSRSFTEAAFQLELDDISPPVKTPFGIHLIRCLEVKPGVTPWYDAQEPIRRQATAELFERLATKQRKLTEVTILNTHD